MKPSLTPDQKRQRLQASLAVLRDNHHFHVVVGAIDDEIEQATNMLLASYRSHADSSHFSGYVLALKEFRAELNINLDGNQNLDSDGGTEVVPQSGAQPQAPIPGGNK